MEMLKIEIVNGYWNLNEKPLKSCSYAKKSLFSNFVMMRRIKQPVSKENTFKQRASEVKAKFNYVFKSREQDFLNGFPNLENVNFICIQKV